MQTCISKGTFVIWFDPKLASPSPKNINKGKTVDISRRRLLPSTNRWSGSFNKLLNPTKIQIGLAKEFGVRKWVTGQGTEWTWVRKKQRKFKPSFSESLLLHHFQFLVAAARCDHINSERRAQLELLMWHCGMWQENPAKRFQNVENIEHLHRCQPCSSCGSMN